MPADLVVHLNRDGPHSIAVEPQQFEADGPFDVVLRNHGAALHVHLHLDDDLSRRATLGTTNHYVDEDSVRRVRVTVDEPLEPVEGRLKLVTGYGAETAYVTVTLDETATDERRVRVDQALGEPRRPAPESKALAGVGDRLVLGLGAVAVLVAIVAAVIVDGVTAVLGLLVVIAGVAVAVALLRN